MAFAGLIALLDDVASVLDDVSALTKVAAGKTAGVVGDDLALNAQQVSGVRAERELPVVWAVAAIVKLDDAGLALARARGEHVFARLKRAAGDAILALAPGFMKALAFVGTAAMFVVGGGILAHGIAPLGRAIERAAANAGGVPGIGALLAMLAAPAAGIVVGIAAGAALVVQAGLAKRALR